MFLPIMTGVASAEHYVMFLYIIDVQVILSCAMYILAAEVVVSNDLQNAISSAN